MVYVYYGYNVCEAIAEGGMCFHCGIIRYCLFINQFSFRHFFFFALYGFVCISRYNWHVYYGYMCDVGREGDGTSLICRDSYLFSEIA